MAPPVSGQGWGGRQGSGSRWVTTALRLRCGCVAAAGQAAAVLTTTGWRGSAARTEGVELCIADAAQERRAWRECTKALRERWHHRRFGVRGSPLARGSRHGSYEFEDDKKKLRSRSLSNKVTYKLTTYITKLVVASVRSIYYESV